MGMIEGFFWGFTFSILGFFWVGEFGKYFSCVWLNLVRDFFGYSKQSQDSW